MAEENLKPTTINFVHDGKYRNVSRSMTGINNYFVVVQFFSSYQVKESLQRGHRGITTCYYYATLFGSKLTEACMCS